MVRPVVRELEHVVEGLDRPVAGETMIGLRRLDNLQEAVETIVRDDIPGDLLEAGVWRGGSTIFMRGALKVLGDTSRNVWVADSFEGLPKPDAEKYPEDEGDLHWTKHPLVVSLEEVKANFAKYGLLDDNVHFLKGWFKDTLSAADIQRLSMLRLDGDMYGSTMDALEALYSKLSPGGFLIVDDYGAVPGCRKAVDDFRRSNAVSEPIQRIDWTGVYWRRDPAQR